MLGPLAIALTLASVPASDVDLQARLALVEVPGVEFRFAQAERLAPAHICVGSERELKCRPPPKTFDINWGSAPELVVPLRYAPRYAPQGGRDEVLLETERGDPLLLI